MSYSSHYRIARDHDASREPTLITPPTEEPLSLPEAKLHCNVDEDSEDTLISAYITAAREHLEQITGRAFITSTWRQFLHRWPCENEIRIAKGKLQSVTHVKYYDSAGEENTFASSNYDVDTDSDPGRVVLKYSLTWPSVTLRPMNPVEVQFVAGWSNASAVPESLKNAMRLLVRHWYDNRNAAGDKSISSSMAFGVEALVSNWRLWL